MSWWGPSGMCETLTTTKKSCLFDRLYKSVEEYDVLQGIFSDMLNTKEITQRAMMKESSADYKAARALYDEVCSSQSSTQGTVVLD